MKILAGSGGRGLAWLLASADVTRLAAVAAELNDRPRKTLGWDAPAARLTVFLRNDRHS